MDMGGMYSGGMLLKPVRNVGCCYRLTASDSTFIVGSPTAVQRKHVVTRVFLGATLASNVLDRVHLARS